MVLGGSDGPWTRYGNLRPPGHTRHATLFTNDMLSCIPSLRRADFLLGFAKGKYSFFDLLTVMPWIRHVILYQGVENSRDAWWTSWSRSISSKFGPLTIRFFQQSPWRKRFRCHSFTTTYQKFSSNSGRADNASPWPFFVSCILWPIRPLLFVRGLHWFGLVLMDPVILSRSKLYGVTDLGPWCVSAILLLQSCVQLILQSQMDEICWSETLNFQPHAGTSMVGGGGGGWINDNQYAPT